ncbi:MAG: hypothetical protein VYD18_12715 [Candidatus Latescibacterota bacterium]|nr:hypothetical protein [Candidatus Latescibacterota bacterium]
MFFDAGAAWVAQDRSDPFTGFRDLALGVDDGPQWKRSVGLAVGTVETTFALSLPALSTTIPAPSNPHRPDGR